MHDRFSLTVFTNLQSEREPRAKQGGREGGRNEQTLTRRVRHVWAAKTNSVSESFSCFLTPMRVEKNMVLLGEQTWQAMPMGFQGTGGTLNNLLKRSAGFGQESLFRRASTAWRLGL